MKSILIATKSSNHNHLTVGTKISRNESSINNYHQQLSNAIATATTTKAESVSETIEKEHYNKLFSNSRKQVIRGKCNVKSDADKVKRVSSDVCEDKNSSNDEQRRLIKLQAINSDNNLESSEYLENRPLIVNTNNNKIVVESETSLTGGGKAGKLINLRKKNGTTLIFQKATNEYRELESYKKRRSLQQWPNTTVSSNLDSKNNTNRHSWYETDYTRAIKEEFDDIEPSLTQFNNEDYNLADINGKQSTFESSELDASNIENVPEIISMKASIDGNATSRRWRIEQFLKNLVGKKPLVPQTLTAQKIRRSPSEHDLLQQHLNQNPDPTNSCGSMTSLNKERLLNKSTASLNSSSLSMVHQKLWSVVPLLNSKEGRSCSNLLESDAIERRSNMRKCETVLALTHEPLLRRHQQLAAPSTSGSKSHSKSINNLMEPIKPLNRLRNSKSCYVSHNDSDSSGQQQTCSRCSSLLSLAAIGSNYSLSTTSGGFVLKTCKHHRHGSSPAIYEIDNNLSKSSSSQHFITNDINKIEPCDSNGNVRTSLVRKDSMMKFTCKLCLSESSEDQMTEITSCGCSFCTECMKAYVEFEITEGAYELSCPDALCSAQGIVSLSEISQLASSSLVAKHHRYRLNREVELDKNRLWCPNRNCETICSVGLIDRPSSSQSVILPSSSSFSNATQLLPRSVLCPTCSLDFCSSCKKPWHPIITCEENSRKMGGRHDSMLLFDNDLIKCCPMCSVPIEKDEGCAQMMCKRCKHVFCWYCLASLDDDFLLRHYDKGPCKNKLGHSRASVVWHRAQVIGIFAGFGILLLVASPLLLLAAPCIVCCKCKIEESTTASKLEAEPLEDVRRNDHQV